MIFNSLLIANRGEIACRIIKTAKEMGIRSVAVYVDADKDALFVKEADESIKLSDGGYLDSKQIINAAKKSGAQAIHPGYGFLSENANFAEILRDHGIKFIGPSVDHISTMGDKINAKTQMEAFNVPCVPGSDGEVKDVPPTLKVVKAVCKELERSLCLARRGPDQLLRHKALVQLDDRLHLRQFMHPCR